MSNITARESLAYVSENIGADSRLSRLALASLLYVSDRIFKDDKQTYLGWDSIEPLITEVTVDSFPLSPSNT